MLKRSFFLLLGTMSTFAICCLGLELEGKAGQIEKTLNGGSPCQLTVISSMNENLLQHLHESQLPLVVGSSDYHLLTHLLPEAIHGPRTKEYCWNLVLASDKLEKEDVSGTLLTIANHLLGRYSSKVIITQNELLTKTDILPSVWYGEHFIVDQAGHIQRLVNSRSQLCNITFRNCHLHLDVPIWNANGQERGRDDGFFPTLLEYLTVPRNISYNLTTLEATYGHLEEDGSFSGTLGVVARREAEIGLSFFTLMHSRFQGADYISPFPAKPIHILSKRPRAKLPGFSLFLLIFDWPSRLLILAGLCFSATFVLLQVMITNKHGKKAFGQLMLLKGLLQQPVLTAPGNLRTYGTWERLFVGTWTISTYLISLMYVSMLTAVYVVPNYEETIETLEDVKASRIPIYLEPGSSFTMMMQTMFPNIETRLLKGYVGKNEVVRQGSLTLVSLPYGGDFCPMQSQFHYSKEPILDATSNYNGWPVLKNSPWAHLVDNHALRLIESGLFRHKYDETMRLHFDRHTCFNKEKQQMPSSIWFSHQSFPFFVLTCGHALAFAAFIVEKAFLSSRQR